MNKIVLELIGVIMVWIACIFIYHSNKIADYFNQNEQQSFKTTIKMTGVLLSILGMVVLYTIQLAY